MKTMLRLRYTHVSRFGMFRFETHRASMNIIPPAIEADFVEAVERSALSENSHASTWLALRAYLSRICAQTGGALNCKMSQQAGNAAMFRFAMTTALFLAAASLTASTAFAKDGWVVSGGATIHYVQTGKGAATLVLIPGWSTDVNVWKQQIAFFSRTMQVVAIDPRGQGQSGKTTDGNTPEQRARDDEAVFRALHLNRVVLVGWSQGVQDIAAFVQQYGTSRLRGIVLVDAAVSKGAGQVSSNPKFVQALLGNIDLYARRKRAYLNGMMHAIFTRKLSDAQFAALVSTGMKTPTSEGIAMLVADMLGADRTPALAKFDKPTLIIASANSSELADQKAEVQRLPQGKFAQIGNAAHGVFIDQPERFDQILSEFISSLRVQ